MGESIGWQDGDRGGGGGGRGGQGARPIGMLHAATVCGACARRGGALAAAAAGGAGGGLHQHHVPARAAILTGLRSTGQQWDLTVPHRTHHRRQTPALSKLDPLQVPVGPLGCLWPGLSNVDVHLTTGWLAGGVVQVRESGQLLMRLAKEYGITVFVIGHVNKVRARCCTEGTTPRMAEARQAVMHACVISAHCDEHQAAPSHQSILPGLACLC